MSTQTLTRLDQRKLENAKEDALKAFEVYKKARAEGFRPMEIILRLWGTEHWCRESKEIFLLYVRVEQGTSQRGSKRPPITPIYDDVERWHTMRVQYAQKWAREDGGDDE